MKTIKKIMVLLLIAAGFVLLYADVEDNEPFRRVLIFKAIGILSMCAGFQLCHTWKLFRDFIDED